MPKKKTSLLAREYVNLLNELKLLQRTSKTQNELRYTSILEIVIAGYSTHTKVKHCYEKCYFFT